jgi:hypothetical protein
LQLQQIALDLRAAFRHATEITHANKTVTARITSTSFRANAGSDPRLALSQADGHQTSPEFRRPGSRLQQEQRNRGQKDKLKRLILVATAEQLA